MNADRFDALTRFFTAGSSRRRVLGSMAAALGAHLASPVPDSWGAKDNKKKRKKRKKSKKAKRTLQHEIQPNGFGCVNVGGACRGDNANCCSGICQGNAPKKGQKDKSRCIAHDTGGCQPGNLICGADGQPCTTSTGEQGKCFTTTGNAGYCVGNGEFIACNRDTDCQALEKFGAQAACVVCLNVQVGTACVSPDVLPPIPV
jgi:hypothetical protein